MSSTTTSRQPIDALALPDALLRISTVSAVTGLSASTIFRKTATGEFPQPIRLGARCTRWRSGDVRIWLECIAAGRPYAAMRTSHSAVCEPGRRKLSIDKK